jgi:hypothetical protein
VWSSLCKGGRLGSKELGRHRLRVGGEPRRRAQPGGRLNHHGHGHGTTRGNRIRCRAAVEPGLQPIPCPRINDAPQIEVVLAGDSTTLSTGAGEPGLVPITAAIANAVYDATGSRIRALPIVPQLS